MSRVFLPILFLFLIILYACNNKKKTISNSELHIGFTSYDAYKIDKKDSIAFIAPPPSVFEENIANNNFIESKEGIVYFYSFPMREPLCGFMTENGKYKFELYNLELDSLKRKHLQVVDENNLDNILDIILGNEKFIYVSIGLQNESTKNKILVKIADSLYHNSYNNVWKVRPLDPREMKLLNE